MSVGILKHRVVLRAEDPQDQWNCGDGGNGLRGDDTCHQRAVAFQLPGQHIGNGGCGDSRESDQHQRLTSAKADGARDVRREQGHQQEAQGGRLQPELARRDGRAAGCSAAPTQSRPSGRLACARRSRKRPVPKGTQVRAIQAENSRCPPCTAV